MKSPGFNPDGGRSKRRTNFKELAGLMGSEDENEVEGFVGTLNILLKDVPSSSRSLNNKARREYVIPLASQEQKDQLLEALFDLGIFPWEEDGQLIIERKKDLKKLEFAGIYQPIEKITEVQTNETVGTDFSNTEYTFPLPVVDDSEIKEVNTKIQEAQRVITGVGSNKLGGGQATEELIDGLEPADTELQRIIDEFDQGITDPEDEAFVRTIGNIPTLSLFPRRYAWNYRVLTDLHTGDIITREDRLGLYEKAKEDEKAMKEVVSMHVGLVLKVLTNAINKFGGDPDDLFQEGLIGLTRAVELYDSSKGEFAGHAMRHIEKGMRKFVFANRHPIYRPTQISGEIRILRQQEAKSIGEDGLVNPEQIFEGAPEMLRHHGENGNRIMPNGVGLDRLKRRYLIGAVFDPVEDFVEAEEPQLQTGDNEAFVNASGADLEKWINRALLLLTEREERVLRLRFGLNEEGRDYTLEEVGDEFGVGRERIRQMEAKALRKLKHPSRSRLLRSLIEDL